MGLGDRDLFVAAPSSCVELAGAVPGRGERGAVAAAELGPPAAPAPAHALAAPLHAAARWAVADLAAATVGARRARAVARRDRLVPVGNAVAGVGDAGVVAGPDVRVRAAGAAGQRVERDAVAVAVRDGVGATALPRRAAGPGARASRCATAGELARAALARSRAGRAAFGRGLVLGDRGAHGIRWWRRWRGFDLGHRRRRLFGARRRAMHASTSIATPRAPAARDTSCGRRARMTEPTVYRGPRAASTAPRGVIAGGAQRRRAAIPALMPRPSKLGRSPPPPAVGAHGPKAAPLRPREGEAYSQLRPRGRDWRRRPRMARRRSRQERRLGTTCLLRVICAARCAPPMCPGATYRSQLAIGPAARRRLKAGLATRHA